MPHHIAASIDAEASEAELAAAMERPVQMEQIRLALATISQNISPAAVAVLLTATGLTYSSDTRTFAISSAIVFWTISMLVIMTVAVVRTRSLLLLPPSDEIALRTRRFLLVVMACAAVGWGSPAWLILPTLGAEQKVYLLVSIPIALAAGAGAVAMCRPLARIFILVMTLVFVSGLLHHEAVSHVIYSLLFLLFAMSICMQCSDQEVAVAKSLRLSFLNQTLLGKRTEQKQEAEQARAQAEVALGQAEKADRAKATFIAATSHDLRQPLHALVQYVAHLKRASGEEGQSAFALGKVEESVAAMSSLLNAVLDFSKVSMGSVQPVMTSVNLVDLLCGLEAQVFDKAQAKGLRFEVQCAVPQGAHHATNQLQSYATSDVNSDLALLVRILSNLVHNAIRYTNEGQVTVRVRPRSDVMRVLVSDSGVGIAAHEKTRIFEEYYQVDNAARDRRKGLGLGLAIVRDLSALLGIRVRVKSTLGRGSTFVLDIPRSDLAPPRKVTTQATPVANDFVRGALVVLVDDDPLARDALALTLSDFGCRLVTAASGEEALHRLSQSDFAPQLMLGDYRLHGGTTGLEAIRAVTVQQQALYGDTFEMPALVVSGDTSPDELARVAAAGYRMLHKPVQPELLYTALNEVLAKVAAKAPT
jgi:two-component system, sensor histidine kinase